jgi:hypothetical protein
MQFMLQTRHVVILIVAIAMSACTTTIASSQKDITSSIPGYSPTPGEWFGSLLGINDIDQKTFQNNICKGLGSNPSDYELTVGATPTLAKSLTHTESDATTTDTPAKGGDELADGTVASSTNPPPPAANQPAPGKLGTLETKTVTDKIDATGPVVKACALKVITAAVDICIYRTANRNALDKLENSGLEEAAALGGTVAGIAALSQASGKETTLITAGTTGFAALTSGLGKAVPSTTSAQASSIVSAGLQYLLIDNNGMVEGGGAKLGLLFDAAFAGCSLNN